MKSAGPVCLATADAMGAQATEHFGKKEKEALSVLTAFLGAICEQASWDAQRQENKDKNTKIKKTRSKVCEYFFEFIFSVERLTLVFTSV